MGGFHYNVTWKLRTWNCTHTLGSHKLGRKAHQIFCNGERERERGVERRALEGEENLLGRVEEEEL
jgi:hypothetical protein